MKRTARQRCNLSFQRTRHVSRLQPTAPAATESEKRHGVSGAFSPAGIGIDVGRPATRIRVVSWRVSRGTTCWDDRPPFFVRAPPRRRVGPTPQASAGNLISDGFTAIRMTRWQSRSRRGNPPNRAIVCQVPKDGTFVDIARRAARLRGVAAASAGINIPAFSAVLGIREGNSPRQRTTREEQA